VAGVPRFRDDAPIFTPEFQGGSFDPWGGPGYDNCRQLTGPDFENVFYKENIIDGATMQNFYMTYGGTSWGWLADPSQVYSSYDYGAAIKEDRELTSKYDEQKRLGYMLGSVAAQFWRRDTGAGPLLIRGPELVRSARLDGATLALTGDTSETTLVEILAPRPVTSMTWDGHLVATQRGVDGALTATVGGPAPVDLPPRTRWRFRPASPEAQPGFDDSSWQLADKATTNNPTPPASPPVLYADDYGFHHGDVWYRAHFRAHGNETRVRLSAIAGRAGIYSAWLNGQFLGSSDDSTHNFDFRFPDCSWQSVTLPHRDATPGEAWYRTTFALHLPATRTSRSGPGSATTALITTAP
jgi:hypothetical protein